MRAPDPAAARRDPTWLVDAALVLLALLAATAVLAEPMMAIAVRAPRNINEGWNAFHAASAMAGGTLYPPADAMVSNNYPPLSFYVVGAVGRLTDDFIIAGRIVALFSLGIVATSIAWLVTLIGGSRSAGIIAGLLFVIHIGIYSADYVAMDDPQWLAHACMSVGLVLIARAPSRMITVVITCLLFLAAGLTKHTLMAVPLAVMLWLFNRNRRSFVAYVGLMATLVVVALAMCVLLYGGDFISGLLGTPRQFSVLKARYYLANYGASLTFAAAVTLLVGVARWADARVRLLMLYAGVAAITGVFLLCGRGTGNNMLFDLTIALYIGLGVAMRRAAKAFADGSKPWVRALLPCVIVAPSFAAVPPFLASQRDNGPVFERVAREWQQQIDFIAQTPGPAACENAAICYWAGKEFALDFFNYGQKLQAHAIDPAAFRQAITTQRFRSMQVSFAIDTDHPLSHSQRLPMEFQDMINRYYRPVFVGQASAVLVPR